jgi:hypothetical protein
MFLNDMPSFEVSSFKYLVNYDIAIFPYSTSVQLGDIQNMVQVLGFMCFHCMFTCLCWVQHVTHVKSTYAFVMFLNNLLSFKAPTSSI